jgi:N-acetylglucosaminyldiphosphoundecaprenol N-acetyl-beta-D-mannosaminyltransferase
MKQNVLGLHFDAFTQEQAVNAVLELSGRTGGKIVVTGGTEHVMMARKQPELASIFNSADILVADGIGVVKASKIIGNPLPERVGGIDLAQALFPRWAERGDRLFLFGGKPGTAQRASENLKKEHPALKITGFRDGYFDTNEPVLAEITASKPNVLIVCLGAPKQERWMTENRSQLGNCVMLGLGGSLDIWAGTVKRAPPVFIKLNAEWLWRLLRQPSRIGRIIKLPGIYRAARKERKLR